MSGTSLPSSATPFRFTGQGGQYFRIWIVNLILTVLTLGIYSAWAKVRTRRYFLGNTWFGGAFDYHATPAMILKGRLIALALALVYVVVSNVQPGAGMVLSMLLLLVMPWVIWRSLRFNTAMTSYRNVRFGFDGSLKEAYIVFLLLPMAPLLLLPLPLLIAGTMGGDLEGGGQAVRQMLSVMFIGLLLVMIAGMALVPYAHKRSVAYLLGNLRYGQGRFTVDLATRRFYGIYLTYVAWLLLVVVVGGLFVTAVLGGSVQELMQGAATSTAGAPDAAMLMILAVGYLPMLLLGIWGRAWFEAKVRNYAFSRMRLDDKLQMASSLSIPRLIWIHVTNLLLLVLTLGLSWPWAQIRLTRYKTETAAAELRDDLDAYVSQQQEAVSALAEEMGDVFDVAPELGF